MLSHPWQNVMQTPQKLNPHRGQRTRFPGCVSRSQRAHIPGFASPIPAAHDLATVPSLLRSRCGLVLHVVVTAEPPISAIRMAARPCTKSGILRSRHSCRVTNAGVATVADRFCCRRPRRLRDLRCLPETEARTSAAVSSGSSNWPFRLGPDVRGSELLLVAPLVSLSDARQPPRAVGLSVMSGDLFGMPSLSSGTTS